MKKSEFSSLPIPYALAFIAEQAGVKWDAEGVEELPEMIAVTDGSYGYKLVKKGGELSREEATEAVRLLSLIPKIGELASIEHVVGVVPHNGRLTSIATLLAGAKP
jgi:hypothetical protein